MTTAARWLGDQAEELVAIRLMESGWRILGRNIRAGHGELDIVAVDPGPPEELVFVEVRWRRRRDFGLAEETFDRTKRARLWRTIAALLEAGVVTRDIQLPRLPVRVDLVVVEPPVRPGDEPRVRHYRAALGG